jgi:hypothetical protein
LDRLSNILKERLAAQQAPSPNHPEADTLLAFVEQGLTVASRDKVLAHLAGCPDCRGTVALATPELEHAAASHPASRGFRFPVAMRWASAAAALAVAIGVGVLSYEHGGSTTAQQQAQHEATAPSSISKPEQAAAATSSNDQIALAKQQRSTTPVSSARAKRIETPSRDAAMQAKIAPNESTSGALVGGLQARSSAGSPLQGGKASAIGALVPGTAQANRVEARPAENRAAAKTDQQYSFGAPAQSQTVEVEAAKIAPAPPASSAGANAAIRAQNSTTTTEAASPIPVETDSTGLRVETPSKTVASAAIGGPVRRNDIGLSRPIVHWTISANGSLQRQSANGSLFPVEPAPGMIVRTVAAQGIEVWAGGTQAGNSHSDSGTPVLFHSSDAGESWTRVNGPWQHAINGLVLSQRGVLTVLTPEGSWSTSDAGKSWSKK